MTKPKESVPSSDGASTSGTFVMSAGVIGQLSEFNPKVNDWTIYQKRMLQFFRANNIEESRKQAILLNLLNEEAYRLMSDLCMPKEPEDFEYKRLVSLLDKHFVPVKPGFYERETFYASNRSASDTIAQWVAKVRNLATSCKFGSHLEMALRDKFVTGLNEGPAKNRLFTEDIEILTLEKAVQIAQATEAAKERSAAAINGMPASGSQAMRIKSEPAEVYKLSPSHGRRQVVKPVLCKVCGYKNHTENMCRFRNYSCKLCNKKGHLRKMCPQRQNKFESPDQKPLWQNKSHKFMEKSENSLFNLSSQSCVKPITVPVLLDDKRFELQVDSGAAVTACSKLFHSKYFSNKSIHENDITLVCYDGNTINPLGYFQVNVSFNNKCKMLKFYVINNGNRPILGLDWMREFNVGLAEINFMSLPSDVSAVISKYNSAFEDKLGKFKYGKIKLNLSKDAVPKFFKPRPIPFVLKSKVEDQLNKLIKMKVLSPVPYSPWGTPIVPVLKPDGTVRICGDYKVTLNKYLEIDKYPLPRIEDLFAKLQGGEEFSKLDLSQAYQQVELDNESRIFTTISTHKGLFAYNRLPYGISSAPSCFQKLIESVLMDLNGVTVFLDDILITGRNREEHLNRLTTVLDRLHKSGLTLKKEKCQFFQKEICYLGFIINKTGLNTDPKKVEGITKAPIPNNVNQLKSFIGMVNFYRKFIPNISQKLTPLYDLTKNDVVWSWTADCNKAFNNIKKDLVSANVLVHYDPEIAIKLTVDASDHGLGAVLTHVFPNGIQKPISYASTTLTDAQKRYSQIEKEALAIKYGVAKFEQYVYGREFTLVTDHLPLVSIFGPKRGIPQMTASRLQRYAVYLSGFNFKIEYIKSNSNIADGLSRLPQNSKELTENDEYVFFNYVTQSKYLKLNIQTLQGETSKDEILCKIINEVQTGWKSKNNADYFTSFYIKRNELSVENNCLFYGYRAVIPNAMREAVLHELHKSHMGIVKMKSMARNYVWWPGMDRDLEVLAKSCENCARHKDSPPKSPLIPWKWPNRPWERIHLDFAVKFLGTNFLILTDARTKWLEVIEMKLITAEATITVLRNIFARFGLPESIVTDNGTQFTSDIFREFTERNGIKQMFSSVRNPETNGAAENSVRTFKQAMLSAIGNESNPNINYYLCNFLLDYRNTAHCTTLVSPAKLFLQRSLRTRLDLLRKSVIENDSKFCKIKENVEHKQQKQIENHGGKRNCKFEVGSFVMVRDYRKDKPLWVKGKLIKILGLRHALVKVEGLSWKRHHNQIREYISRSVDTDDLLKYNHIGRDESSEKLNEQQNNATDLDNSNDYQSRPKREVRPPDRWRYSTFK